MEIRSAGRGTSGSRICPKGLCAILATIVVGSGCDGARGPLPPPDLTPRHIVTLYNIAVTDDSSWNYYAADVVTNLWLIDGTDTVSSHVYAYRDERTLGADGFWAYVTTFDDSLKPAPGLSIRPKLAIQRLETHESGSYFRMYDYSGALVSTRTNSDLAANGVDTVDFDGGALQSSAPVRPVARAPGAGPRRDPRAWLSTMVITPDRGRRLREAMERRLGPARPDAAGGPTFILQRGALTFETRLDPVHGGIAEETVRRGSQLISRTVNEYQRVRPDLWVQARSRLEMPQPVRPGALIVTEHYLHSLVTATR